MLTDIAGMEDHFGDMDFKVAGTAEGITALQMDIKIKGITHEIMEKALAQARDARLFILDKMLEAIAAPRTELSPYAPRMYRISIPQEKIGMVIGPGGRVIRSIIEETQLHHRHRGRRHGVHRLRRTKRWRRRRSASSRA